MTWGVTCLLYEDVTYVQETIVHCLVHIGVVRLQVVLASGGTFNLPFKLICFCWYCCYPCLVTWGVFNKETRKSNQTVFHLQGLRRNETLFVSLFLQQVMK